jgi:hypothetical protein
MFRSTSIRQLAQNALLCALVILPVACGIDSRAGKVIEGAEPGDAGRTVSPLGSDMGAGSSVAGARSADASNELGATAPRPVGGRAESGGVAGASHDVGPTNADETSGAAGSGGSGATGTRNDTDTGTTESTGVGPAPVFLGAAATYAVLAQAAITNIPSSAITGNVGISPAAASSITGFPLTRAGTRWSTPEVVGEVFAADNDPPTPSELTSAISDMQAAYDDAAGRTTPESTNLGDGNIGGLTLTPGLYRWTSVVDIPSDLTLSGAANDAWIFQITGDLTLAPGTSMLLSGGAQAKNIVWQVAGFVDLGTTSHAEGILLSKTAIHLKTGASIDGRLLAQTAVTLDRATISAPQP